MCKVIANVKILEYFFLNPSEILKQGALADPHFKALRIFRVGASSNQTSHGRAQLQVYRIFNEMFGRVYMSFFKYDFRLKTEFAFLMEKPFKLLFFQIILKWSQGSIHSEQSSIQSIARFKVYCECLALKIFQIIICR